MTLSDNAITNPEDDRLGRAPLVEKLVEALVRGDGKDRKATEVVLGLTGPWGCGKSSVLNLLSKKLGSEANIAVVNFNPWLVGARDDLLLALLDEMQIQLGRSTEQFARNVAQAIHRYRKVLAPAAALVPGVGGALAEAIKGIPDGKARSPTEERKTIEKALREAAGAVVVLIDEFDRLEPGEMKAMGQAIKAAMDLPNISWVIALDIDKVTSALADEGADWALGFIAKVITVNVPLRPLTDEEKEKLLGQYLDEAGVGEPILQSHLYPTVRSHLLRVLETPRDIKRTVATYATMYRMVGWAVFSCDVLGWAALGTMRPELQRKASNRLKTLCIGEDLEEDVIDLTTATDESSEQIINVFGLDLGKKDPIFSLLNFMFPNDLRFDTTSYGRIQFYFNAWNLLWLGDAPFTWRLEQIQEFWSEPERFFNEQVDHPFDADILEDTFRRLPDLDPSGDHLFFRLAICRCRSAPLLDRALQEHFLRQVVRSTELKARMRRVFYSLIADGDLVLVPLLIRSQVGRHGIRGFRANPEQPEFLDAAELEALLSQEVPRWRDWVVTGEWLKQTNGQGPLQEFVELADIAETDRAVVMSQLEDRRNICMFAKLVTHHNQHIKELIFDKLTNRERLISLLETAIAESDRDNRSHLMALQIMARHSTDAPIGQSRIGAAEVED